MKLTHSSRAKEYQLKMSFITLVGILLLYNFSTSRTTATNPLIYNRLRHDAHYLQLYRNFQPKEPYDESPMKLKLSANYSKDTIHTYYQNDQINASSITYDDLVLEALDRTYMSRYMQTYLYNYDNPQDKLKASDPNLVSPARCKVELKYLTGKLATSPQRELQNASSISPELAAFFDSYATEESGVLFGNYHWTGNWRQCSRRLIFDLDRANQSSGFSFRGRYCIASIRSDRWQQTIERRARERNHGYFLYPEQADEFRRFFRIQVGLCLPESCDSTSFDLEEESGLIRQLTMYKLNEPFKSYKLVDLFCLPDESSELRQLDSGARLFVMVIACWCLMIVAATCYDVMQESASISTKKLEGEGIVDKFVSAMSLKRNFARLVQVGDCGISQTTQVVEISDKRLEGQFHIQQMPQRAPVPEDLRFLNAFKALTISGVLSYHQITLSRQLERFPLDYSSIENDLMFHMHINRVFVMDWFFTVTSFIAAYSAFATIKINRVSLGQWIYSLVHRYWRLAPMYIIIFWFCRTVFQHMGSGPTWDYGTSNATLRGVCKRESWLYPIGMLSNFNGLHEECIIPSWFLSSCMQFALITPILLIGLAKWPIVTYLGTVGLIGASVIARIHLLLSEKETYIHLNLLKPRYDIYMDYKYFYYFYPQYRISPYLIGLLAGHHAYMVVSGRRKSVFYNHEQKYIDNSCQESDGQQVSQLKHRKQPLTLQRIYMYTTLFMLAQSLIFSWLLEKLLPSTLDQYAKYLTAALYGTSHTLHGILAALVLFSFIMFESSNFKWFLSRPFWTIVSRLSISALLIHCELITWIHQSRGEVPNWSGTDLVKDWIQLMFYTYPLAAILTIFIEMPLANLDRNFIRGSNNKLCNEGTAATSIKNAPNSGLERSRDHCQNNKNNDNIA